MIVRVPGDKSITQRALILSGLADGESRIRGLLDGADPRSTAAALRRLGVPVPPLPSDGSEVRVRGRGLRGLARPAGPLDLGNSGTGARLLLGVLAAQDFSSVVSGDASLVTRPMARVTDPLELMGARFEGLGEPGHLPLRVTGRPLRPLEYDLPVASAQVKSALLLAGLVGGAFVLLTEPVPSRDHTERMLSLVGAPVLLHDRDGRRAVDFRDPPDAIRPLDLDVPGDFSSAAFLLAAGLLGSEPVTVEGVGLNPTRTGVLPILERMGADLDVERSDGGPGEPVGSVSARPSRLRATRVEGHEVPAAVDEIPLVAVAAARAEGVTSIGGAGELRLKETDRLRALATNLRGLGVEVEETEDGLEIEGTDRPLEGRVRSWGDHRMAMAFAVLGAATGGRVEIDDPSCVDVSFPDFFERLAEVTGR